MRRILILLLYAAPFGVVAQTAPPSADIASGFLRARLYLPDTAHGYYRGSRFDWSGVMPVLEYQGHSYCAQWFDVYEPTIHDAIMGPVESFSPLGYEDARPGGTFVAVGIGTLTRSDEAAYSPFRYYPIKDAGQWTIKSKQNRISFTQTLRADSGYAYVYEKTIVLKGADMKIAHALRNTGTHPIHTDVYDHNLFVLDHQPIGPGFSLRFPWRITGQEQARNIGTIAQMGDSSISFLRAPDKTRKEQVYAVLKGFGAYDILESNSNSRAAVRITCDRPLSKMVFWGCATTACPEPYIAVDVPPGQTFLWTITYHFYTL
jgi:hypothetical protein